MIINLDIKPERQIYFISSEIAREILRSGNEEIDFFEIYFSLKKRMDISMNLFTFSLDWLYLLGFIKNVGGKIVRCL